MIGKIIIGICLIVAVIIFVQPQYATPVFDFLVGALAMAFWICIVGIVVVAIIVILVVAIVIWSD